MHYTMIIESRVEPLGGISFADHIAAVRWMEFGVWDCFINLFIMTAKIRHYYLLAFIICLGLGTPVLIKGTPFSKMFD